MIRTSDLRVASMTPLVTPEQLKGELPLSEQAGKRVLESRGVVEDIILGRDKRVIAIIGPCSIHDPAAALDYARRLAGLKSKIEDRICPIMRVYFEKPRTAVGWPGLIFDPRLDGSGDIAAGLRVARGLLLDITGLGLAAGSEILDPIVPQYISDLISWASIGARTTESQTHRMMASGLSMPVGFKNSVDGSLDAAVNAMAASAQAHSFIGIDQDGRTALIRTTGNPVAHLILRGGRLGPNYYEENVEKAEALLERAGATRAIMVDCSHANSGKRHVRQERVLQAFIDQRTRGRSSLIGFMIESNLFEGSQPLLNGLAGLKYGVSVTDECIGWQQTEELLLAAWKELGR